MISLWALSGVGVAQGQPLPSPPAARPPVAAPVYQPLRPADRPSTLGRVVTFQKSPGADQTTPPPTPPSQTDPRQGLEAGKGQTAPATKAPPPPTAVNRDTAFRLESDAKLNKRIIDELVTEARERATDPRDRAVTPDNYVLPEVNPVAPAGTTYVPKTVDYPPTQFLLDPSFVAHRRLYFEDLNTERYGWDLGLIQPLLSAGTFYKDIFFMPAKFATQPHERYETSAGKCRPGDPVPYFMYPPEYDIWGYAAQGVTLVGAGFVFPY